jgi:hypothetical protein
MVSSNKFNNFYRTISLGERLVRLKEKQKMRSMEESRESLMEVILSKRLGPTGSFIKTMANLRVARTMINLSWSRDGSQKYSSLLRGPSRIILNRKGLEKHP